LRLARALELARSQPPQELLSRGASKVARAIDRRWRKAWARLVGTAISPAELRAALRRGDSTLLLYQLRSSTGLSLPAAEQAAVLTALESFCPGAKARTISAADRACDHVFDLLGSGPVSLGTPIDWHVDFKTGHHYDPHAWHTDIEPTPFPGGHDIKVPWELSRAQHLPWLSQAYLLTGDEKYAREFVAQVGDWIDANPTGFGVNWVCTMDVAIRAVNWLWAYYSFASRSAVLGDEFHLKFQGSLLAHGRHIASNLETSGGIDNNHYFADLVGLMYLAIACKDFRESDKWREVALDELWHQVEAQVLPDGADFEASISYHRLVAELLLSTILLMHRAGVEIPKLLMRRMEAMLEFTLHYTRPDGGTPMFGDCDNGRLHRLKAWDGDEREWSDHRHLLAIGAVLFERDDFALAADDQWEEAFWMLGAEAVRFREGLNARRDAATEPASRLFPDAGIAVMRGGGTYVAVDAGGNGQGGNGGHKHGNALGFELAFGDRPWMIDPGTFAYTPNYEARNRFRSSSVHPVLVIDGQEINRFDPRELFTMTDDARPKVESWSSSAERDRLVATHRGYERLAPPASVRRAFVLQKRTGRLLVRDEAACAGRHAFACDLLLDAATVTVEDRVAWIESPGSEWHLALCVASPAAGVRLAVGAGFVSRSYGRQAPVPVLEIRGEFDDALQLAMAFLPCRGTRTPANELRAIADALLAESADEAC
jgi:uncharacterized heparinase superfamily protein